MRGSTAEKALAGQEADPSLISTMQYGHLSLIIYDPWALQIETIMTMMMKNNNNEKIEWNDKLIH